MPDAAARSPGYRAGTQGLPFTLWRQAATILSQTCDLPATALVEALFTSGPSVRAERRPPRRSPSRTGARRLLGDRGSSVQRSIPEVLLDLVGFGVRVEPAAARTRLNARTVWAGDGTASSYAGFRKGVLACGLFLLRRWQPAAAFDAFVRRQLPFPHPQRAPARP
jgi:hypothetical protein